MKNEMNAYLNGNRITRIFNFQQAQEAPLAELSRLVLAESYFGALTAMQAVLSPALSIAPPQELIREATHKGEYMDVASFSLTKYFGSSEKAMENYEKMAKVAARFHIVHAMAQSGLDSTCTIVSEPLTAKDARGNTQSDILLVCYSGRVDAEGWEKHFNPSDNPVKSKFFAHLLHEGLITREQLSQNGIDLGKYGHETSQEKKFRESAGKKKDAPKA